MLRRDVLAGIGAGALSAGGSLRAQDAARPAKVAVLIGFEPQSDDRIAATFLKTPERLGWVQGRNLDVRTWSTQNDADRISSSLADIIAWKPDVIASTGNNLTIALKQSVNDIPIVFEYALDPVRAGWAASISHPGGNITGISASTGVGLWPKRISLLKPLFSPLRQVGVLIATTSPTSAEANRRALTDLASRDGFDLRIRTLSRQADIEPAAASAKAEGDQIVLVAQQTFSGLYRLDIVRALNAAGLPSFYELREPVELGGLMAHGAGRLAIREHQAVYVDKILRGAKAGDLPIDQPTVFELVINLKTAAALGLTIPPDLLAQADEVIE